MNRAITAMLILSLGVLTFVVHLQPAEPRKTYGVVLVPVPFYYQEKDYYCGCASLEMVFDYYGENISQSEIACVSRTLGEPFYETMTDELRRAAHFSNVSTSMGNELPGNITGYTLRRLGYAAFEFHSMDLTTLESFLDEGKPLILLMWYSSRHVSGHYRVATGYNETHVFLHDPWNKPLWGGTWGGPNIAFNNTEFLELWSYDGGYALYACPWTVSFSTPVNIKVGTPFQIGSTITYPQQPPNALSAYPATSCVASITLPSNLILAQGESQEKTIGTGFLQAGDSSSLNWTVIADSYGDGVVTVTCEGTVSGSVTAEPNYPPYSYSDRIGATANFTVNVMPPPADDVAVTDMTLSKTIVGRGYSVNLNITVANQGGHSENFTVAVCVNTLDIATLEFNLSSGSTAAQTVAWDTGNSAYGKYVLWAYATPVPNETNTANNNCTGGEVVVTVCGDVDGNFQVDRADLSLLCDGFGSTLRADSNYWHRPPCAHCPHSSDLDVDGNRRIDMGDISMALSNFEETLHL